MNILFTKSNKILSKTITELTGESVSHVVLDFGQFVVHSNLLGVHLEWSANFRKHCKVVYELQYVGNEDNIKRLNSKMEELEWKLYDFGALLFVGICLLLRSKFKIPLPKSNLWQSSGMFMCTEFVSKFIDIEVDSMITPYSLYEKLKSSEEFKELT